MSFNQTILQSLMSENNDESSKQQHGPSSAAVADQNAANKYFKYLKPLKPSTIDELVVALVVSDELILNKSFVFSFFLSSRCFLNSDELLMSIFDKCINYILKYNEKISRGSVHEGILRLILILKEWTLYFPYDFRDVKTIETLKFVIDKSLMLDSSVQIEFNDIAKHLAKEIGNLEKYEEYLKKLHVEEEQKLKRNYTNMIKVCDDPILLAMQLTLIELDRLTHIGPEEFVHYFLTMDKSSSDEQQQMTNNESIAAAHSNYNANKPQPKIEFTSDLKSNEFRTYLENVQRTRELETKQERKLNQINYALRTSANIEAYILWTNRLSNFVSGEIVKNLDQSNRIRIIHFFIDCAHACFELGNFNSSMAIIAGLSSFSVSRLRRTWKEVDKTKWNYLLKYTDSSSNYFVYRRILKTNRGNNARAAGSLFVPIFSVVMKDLRYLYNSIPNTIEHRKVNLDKFWQVAKYISDNIYAKNLKANFIQRTEILNHMLTEPILTDEACAYLSFKCEEARNDTETKYSKSIASKFVTY